MAKLVDGRPLKLRTSCDSCSESKVRCSQTKPVCERCEKNGIGCKYGLSRRSHKSAARIGASSSQASSPSTASIGNADAVLASLSQSQLFTSPNPEPQGLSNLDVMDDLEAGSTDAQSMQYLQKFDFENMAIDNFFNSTMNADLPPEPDPFKHQQPMPSLQLQSLGGFEGNLSNATGGALVTSVELLDQPWPTMDPDIVQMTTVNNGDARCGSADRSGCLCTLRLLKSLLALESACIGDQPSFDIQLSLLKNATKFSEDCISCSCQKDDEFATVTNGILISRIIQGYASALASAKPEEQEGMRQPRSRRSSPKTSLGPSPPLLWGAMQFDQDEMEDLKQHVWMVQFRKIEKLLELLGDSVTRMKAAGIQPLTEGEDSVYPTPREQGGKETGAYGDSKANNTQDSGFAVACECIYTWLNGQAQTLRERYEQNI